MKLSLCQLLKAIVRANDYLLLSTASAKSYGMVIPHSSGAIKKNHVLFQPVETWICFGTHVSLIIPTNISNRRSNRDAHLKLMHISVA